METLVCIAAVGAAIIVLVGFFLRTFSASPWPKADP